MKHYKHFRYQPTMQNRIQEMILLQACIYIILIILSQIPITDFIQKSMSYYNTSNSTYGSHNRYSKSVIKSQPITSKPQGLENLTNTCYISACLQILFRLVPENLNGGIITTLFNRLKRSCSKKDYENFKEGVQKYIQIVKGWQQQDAQQFLISFLQILNQQNSKVTKKGKINLQYNQKQNVHSNWKNFVNEMEKIQYSQITKLFYGQLVRQFECPDGHIKHIFQRYMCKSLSFPQTKSQPSYGYGSSYSSYSYNGNSSRNKLIDLINNEYETQIVDDLLCQKCNKKRRFQKRSYLYSLPKYLILHLARFKKGYYSNQKISNIVEYDEFIQLKEQRTQQIIKYRLRGVIEHYGSLNRGHYFCHVKDNGQWYLINDEQVSKDHIQTKGNQSKYVYLLFYERI